MITGERRAWFDFFSLTWKPTRWLEPAKLGLRAGMNVNTQGPQEIMEVIGVGFDDGFLDEIWCAMVEEYTCILFILFFW